MLESLAKLSNILILANENQEIFSLSAVVVLFTLKKIPLKYRHISLKVGDSNFIHFSKNIRDLS